MKTILLSLLLFSQITLAGPPIIWGSPYPTLLSGGVKMRSDTSTTCNAAAAGSIRYNAGTFEGCDGATWTSMTNAAAGVATVANGGTGSAVATENFVTNFGLTASVAVGALTINMKQADSATAPAAASGGVGFSFRGTVAQTGGYSVVARTTTLSLVVPSGATLGLSSGPGQLLYIYVVNGTGLGSGIEMCAAGSLIDEGALQNATAITSGSTVASTLYCTSNQSSQAIRLVAILTINESSIGTWAAQPTNTNIMPVNAAPVSAVGSATPTASTISKWDASVNMSADSFIQGYATTATSASTTTLTVDSKQLQFFTGSTTQTVTLPVTSTLVLGQQYKVVNLSSGAVTVNSSGGNAIQVMVANTELLVTVILTSGTSTASWEWAYTPSQSSALGVASGGTGTGTAFTAGSVLFATTNGVYAQDNTGLFWNSSTHKLGVGTATPATAFANNSIEIAGDLIAKGNHINISTTQGFQWWADATPSKAWIVAPAGFASSGGTTGSMNFMLFTGSQWDTIMTLEQTSKEVGIGTTAPSAQLHTTSTVRFANFGVGTATFDASGNISSVSDERLKDIQRDFTRGLDDLAAIRPIIFKWNKKSGLEMEHEYAGFSAQNVRANIPEAVGQNKKGYLSLDDRSVIATLVNAVNELNGEVKMLKQNCLQVEH